MDDRLIALANARNRLAEVASADLDAPFVLDAAIQRFEFTYELAWKTLRRALRERVPEDRLDGISRSELYHLGVEEGLIENASQWLAFHEGRNLTSHLYREETARTVAALCAPLSESVTFLLSRLNGDSS